MKHSSSRSHIALPARPVALLSLPAIALAVACLIASQARAQGTVTAPPSPGATTASATEKAPPAPPSPHASVSSSGEEAAPEALEYAAPLQVGDATQDLFAWQRSGVIASPTPRPIAGAVAYRSYERYLKSFEYPIPERLNSSVKSSSNK